MANREAGAKDRASAVQESDNRSNSRHSEVRLLPRNGRQSADIRIDAICSQRFTDFLPHFRSLVARLLSLAHGDDNN